MKKIITFFVVLAFCNTTKAQIDLSNINLESILGKVLTVKKGFAPKFSIGKVNLPKIMKVAEIIGVKKNTQANKYFNTFKNGRTVYKVAQYAGLAVSTYSAIKSMDKSAVKEQYQKPLAAALGTMASGLIVKLLTKGASYKAVDIFNGAAKKKLKDILNIGASSQGVGIGLYVKL